MGALEIIGWTVLGLLGLVLAAVLLLILCVVGWLMAVGAVEYWKYLSVERRSERYRLEHRRRRIDLP